jgi:hypothetical protein
LIRIIVEAEVGILTLPFLVVILILIISRCLSVVVFIRNIDVRVRIHVLRRPSSSLHNVEVVGVLPLKLRGFLGCIVPWRGIVSHHWRKIAGVGLHVRYLNLESELLGEKVSLLKSFLVLLILLSPVALL